MCSLTETMDAPLTFEDLLFGKPVLDDPLTVDSGIDSDPLFDCEYKLDSFSMVIHDDDDTESSRTESAPSSPTKPLVSAIKMGDYDEHFDPARGNDNSRKRSRSPLHCDETLDDLYAPSFKRLKRACVEFPHEPSQTSPTTLSSTLYVITRDRGGTCEIEYDDSWKGIDDALPRAVFVSKNYLAFKSPVDGVQSFANLCDEPSGTFCSLREAYVTQHTDGKRLRYVTFSPGEIKAREFE